MVTDVEAAPQYFLEIIRCQHKVDGSCQEAEWSNIATTIELLVDVYFVWKKSCVA